MSDKVKELEGLIKELAEQVKGSQAIKEKVEELQAKLAVYEEAAKKGFPIPAIPEGATEDEAAKIIAPYEMAKQGKRLMDSFLHPTHVIEESTRQELAKYFCLFLKAGVFQDPVALARFRDIYGDARAEVKTAIGDTGNVFPVPDVVESEILAFAREKSVVLQYCRVWDMTSEKQSFPSETGSVTVDWGNTTSESEPTVSEVELSAEELSAYSVVKNATLADARTDIVSWLTEAMAEAAGLELDNEAFNGDGSNVCSGILSAACGYSVVMSSGSTSFSAITADVLSQMIAKLDGLKKQGARFWMHGQILHYIRTLKDNDDRPIFIETVGSPMSGTIWGYPYSEVIKMPSTSGANTAFVAFGNLRYFSIGRRLDTTTLQVDPYGLWTTNRTRFKLYQRWGMKIGLANGFVRLLTAAS